MHRVAPIAVLDWEVTNPAFPSVPDELAGERVVAIRLLVRERGRPIGWLQLDTGDASRTHAQTAQAAARQLEALQTLRQPAAHMRPPSAPTPAAARKSTASAAISVIVCTRDRTDSLARCLDSLLLLDHPAFEIVVVDNAPSSDTTRAYVAALRNSNARALHAVRYVRESTPGLDWARNLGMHEARHDLIAYTDDDVQVDADWLSAISLGFSDTHVQLVTGFVVPAELATAAQVVFEDWYGGMGKGTVAREYLPSDMGAHDRLGAHHLGVGANMAFRTAWLRALGGFDTALDVGTASHGAGDLDAFHRTLLAGGIARYEPAAIVRHYHRREMGALKRQLRDNGRAFGVFLLSRWSAHERPRAPVAHYAVRVWLNWMIQRIPRRLLGREKLPLSLQFEELRGVFEAPRAWRNSYAEDRRRRASRQSS